MEWSLDFSLQKMKTQGWTRDSSVAHLPSKYKTLDSNPGTAKKKIKIKKDRTRKEHQEVADGS
jgi:hypothetical protein